MFRLKYPAEPRPDFPRAAYAISAPMSICRPIFVVPRCGCRVSLSISALTKSSLLPT